MSKPPPLYTLTGTTPSFQLLWSLSLFWRDRPLPVTWIEPVAEALEADSIRILQHTESNGSDLLLLSTLPQVAPQTIVQRVKGRITHHLRGTASKPLRRNFSLSSMGKRRATVIHDYVASQLGHHRMADPSTQAMLERYQWQCPASENTGIVFAAHGRYEYNLHVVFVRQERWTEVDEGILERMMRVIRQNAAKHGHRLFRTGILADHVHLALGCPIGSSPADVALSYLNNLAYIEDMRPVYQFGYYVGTYGGMDTGALRQ